MRTGLLWLSDDALAFLAQISGNGGKWFLPQPSGENDRLLDLVGAPVPDLPVILRHILAGSGYGILHLLVQAFQICPRQQSHHHHP